MDKDKLKDQVSSTLQQWSKRHNRIRDDRNVRYGRDDVLSTIPVELQSTDFEYHSMDLDEAVMDMSAFMSASGQTWTVNPPRDRDAKKADDIESVLSAIFGPNGVLETESGGEVAFMVWQNQVEPSGQGIYKMTLKRDYPLRMPQRKYSDEQESAETEFEENPDYRPPSRRRKNGGQEKYRETDASLSKRQDSFMEEEFPWQWRSVDPIHYFKITQDGVTVAAGEYSSRSAAILDEYGKADLKGLDKGFVYLSESDSDGNGTTLVNVLEVWTDTQGYLCITSPTADSTDRKLKLEDLKEWENPLGRVPYFEANGLMTNDKALENRYSGAFTKLLSEIPLLNHLETMHFNAVHRGFFPMYYPVKDPQFKGETLPMEAEQIVAVTQADMERTELPPGWKWEVMPSGFEPDLNFQLQSARDRVKDSAIAAVLSGRSTSSGDSGAKISLLINAATRNIDPFRRHHQGALKEMAQTMLRCSKKLKLDLNVSIEEQQEDGSRLVKALSLKPSDIVSTDVDIMLNVQLPVDQGAAETRGITLITSGMRSYQSAAPEFFRVGDPIKEKERIALERREQQIDDIAFQLASMQFQQRAPSVYADIIGSLEPLTPLANNVGGGPQGAYGGASAMLGRGGPALPSATQVDGSAG